MLRELNRCVLLYTMMNGRRLLSYDGPAFAGGDGSGRRSALSAWRLGIRAAALVIASSVAFAGACLGQTCPSLSFEGEVAAGQSYSHKLDAAHTFLLESLPSGWIIRVLPASGPRPQHDYAELATPPYRSPNPILISTDFSFRAQDAIAWNPRAFAFFTTQRQLAQAAEAYAATLRAPDNPAAAAGVLALLPQACPAELRILDARIVGGTADQSPMAAAVASHFAETAHTLETTAAPSRLGRILRMRFRVQVGAPPRARHAGK
jgi:hypothetical protein